MTHQKTIRVTWLLAGALLFSASAFAEDGKGEIAGFGGGIALGGGDGTHTLFGGSAGFRLVDNLRVFGEFTYTPLNSLAAAAASQASAMTGASVTATAKLLDFGGGVDYSFGSSKTFVPYVLGAVGVGRLSASATATVGGVSGYGSAGANSMYLGGGGGVRIYAGQHWGIKPEVRFQRYGGTFASNTAVFTVGLFYHFGR